MMFDNPLTERKADSGPGVLFAGVKALEYLEDTLLVIPVDSNPFIAHRDDPLLVLAQKAAAIPLGDLAESITIEEDEPTAEWYRRICTDLYHSHLPYMREVGLIHYDGASELGEVATDRSVVTPYLHLAGHIDTQIFVGTGIATSSFGAVRFVAPKGRTVRSRDISAPWPISDGFGEFCEPNSNTRITGGGGSSLIDCNGVRPSSPGD